MKRRYWSTLETAGSDVIAAKTRRPEKRSRRRVIGRPDGGRKSSRGFHALLFLFCFTFCGAFRATERATAAAAGFARSIVPPSSAVSFHGNRFLGVAVRALPISYFFFTERSAAFVFFFHRRRSIGWKMKKKTKKNGGFSPSIGLDFGRRPVEYDEASSDRTSVVM